MNSGRNKGLEQTVKDIKSLKIQGAENVAKEAVKSLGHVLDMHKGKSAKTIFDRLLKAREVLFKTRPTEPCMRNALNFVLHDVEENCQDNDQLIINVNDRIKQALDLFEDANEKITDYGSQKIKDRMVVYTHCHSSTVTRIIIDAWKKEKHIEVHNTETRPRFQGRKTAVELAQQGIPVVHYVDSAARFALKKADLMLIGADALTAEGKVINKIGSELFAEVADRYGVPLYICTNSWKFDPATVFGFEEPIEKRFSSEVWEKPPKNVRIDNFAFEQVDPRLVTGVITELGIYKPQTLVQVVRKKYPWMFDHGKS
jgi:ribose 1,5-bisphosphate isomerase